MARTGSSKKRSPRRPPRSVEVAGQKVRVRIRDLEDAFGQFWPDERLIEIDRTHLANDPDEAWLTFRHELMEAALFLSGVGYMETYQQEPVVRAMEQVFFPVWDRLNRAR
jgi:hypothetical protein